VTEAADEYEVRWCDPYGVVHAVSPYESVRAVTECGVEVARRDRPYYTVSSAALTCITCLRNSTLAPGPDHG
jgi:hypothetical protein